MSDQCEKLVHALSVALEREEDAVRHGEEAVARERARWQAKLMMVETQLALTRRHLDTDQADLLQRLADAEARAMDAVGEVEGGEERGGKGRGGAGGQENG